MNTQRDLYNRVAASRHDSLTKRRTELTLELERAIDAGASLAEIQAIEDRIDAVAEMAYRAAMEI